MKTRITLLALCALLLPAAAARGALRLNVEEIILRPGDTGFVEVFFTEMAPAQNENLVAYAVALELRAPPGVTFGPGPYVREPIHHPFVFPAGTPIDDTGSGPTRIRASSAILGEPENIADNEGVLRVPITVAPGTPFGPVRVFFVVGGGLTEFSDDIGSVIDVHIFPVVPEPSAAGVACTLALAALGRRRR